MFGFCCVQVSTIYSVRVSFYDISLCYVGVSIHKIKISIYYYFSWEGVGTLPQNSYKPSRDLWEATLLRRIRSVQQLARSFSTNRQTHRKTSCYFIIRIMPQIDGNIDKKFKLSIFYRSWVNHIPHSATDGQTRWIIE